LGTPPGLPRHQFNAVAESDTPAVALYASLGFATLTTIPEAFRHPEQATSGCSLCTGGSSLNGR
jgi:hypothetical protein